MNYTEVTLGYINQQLAYAVKDFGLTGVQMAALTTQVRAFQRDWLANKGGEYTPRVVRTMTRNMAGYIAQHTSAAA